MPEHPPGCACCGGTLDPARLAVRSAWPEAMFGLSPEQREATWGNRNLRRADGLGSFVRCLMPVRLTGGSVVEYSVWLKVDDDQLRHADKIWKTPEYATLQLSGHVANGPQPWPALLGTPGRAEVRDPDAIPFLLADGGTLLHRVLHDEWDRDDVLSRIAHALPTTIRERITETWSLERTAGLEPRSHGDQRAFTGAGRTVHLFPYTTPQGMSPSEAIAAHTRDAPPRDRRRTDRTRGSPPEVRILAPYAPGPAQPARLRRRTRAHPAHLLRLRRPRGPRLGARRMAIDEGRVTLPRGPTRPPC